MVLRRTFSAEDLVGTELDHGLHLPFTQVLVLLHQPPLLDHHRVEVQFLLGALDDLFLDGVLGYKAEHPDLS